MKWGNLTRLQVGDFAVAAGASNVSGGNDQFFLLPPECVLEVMMILERLSSLIVVVLLQARRFSSIVEVARPTSPRLE